MRWYYIVGEIDGLPNRKPGNHSRWEGWENHTDFDYAFADLPQARALGYTNLRIMSDGVGYDYNPSHTQLEWHDQMNVYQFTVGPVLVAVTDGSVRLGHGDIPLVPHILTRLAKVLLAIRSEFNAKG